MAPATVTPKETYVVSTQGKDSDEVVVRTLVGDYMETGTNHGRKVFKKVGDGRPEAIDVFMYYWDNRDGPSFEGWWFGNKLGGTQVWSHNNSQSLTPPQTGWKIPWDGKVRPTLSVTNKVEQAKNEAQAKMKTMSNDNSEVSSAAKSALEQAKAAAGDYISSEGLKEAERLLQPQLTKLAEAMKTLTDAQRAGSNTEVLRQVQQMRSGLQALMSAINVELGKVRSSKLKAEASEKQKALEERDMAVFQEVLPEAVSKANAAEDAVEKAVITSEMITAGGDDMDEVRQAVTSTEQAVQEAQKAMGEARIFLNAKQAAARRYESDAVKQKAAQELGALQAQLQEAQSKLNPLKNVRQDFVQRTAAQKVVQEVLEKLSPAEVDVDRAEEATEMLKTESTSKELMQQAQQAVAKAGDHINTVMRFIDTKKKTAVGLAKDDLMKMEDRARQSQQRLADLKSSQKEASERVGLEVLVKEAEEKLKTVSETVAKAADAEGPFLMGVEELPLDETLAAVKAVETASTAANTATSIARMFIATKLVEAKRFTPELSREAQTKLKAFQTELETHTKRLNELKKSTAERKKAVTVREAEHEVKKAEDLAKKVAEAASNLEDDKLTQLSVEEIRTASEATIKAEQEASKHLAETRKFITTRQIEAKGREASSEMSSELIKYEARLRAVATEIGKYKKVTASVESRLAAKKSLEDCAAKVTAVEEKFQKLSELSAAIDSPPPEGEDSKDHAQKTLKAAEQAAAEVQASVKSAMRFLDMQMRVTPSAAKEVEKLRPKLDETQESLDKTVGGMRERSEKVQVDGIVKDSEAKLKEVEEAIKKLLEAEKPFKSEEEMAAEKVPELLSALESASHAATQALSGAKTFAGVKKLAVRRLSEGSKQTAEEQLNSVVGKLDELTKTLSESKKSMIQRKQDLVKKEIEGKVMEVERLVKIAEEATEKAQMHEQADKQKEGEEAAGEAADGDKKTEGTAAVPADEMKAACEKAGAAQAEARTSLTAAQKLLLSRQKEAKGGSAPPSSSEEIARQLEKITELQGKLDKHKASLKDQEHRYVAQRLQKDASAQIEKLEEQLAKTSDKAAPLTSEDNGMTGVVFLSHAVDNLRQLMKKSSKTPKELFADATGSKGHLSEAAFLAKLKEIEESDPQAMTLSEEQLKAAFGRLANGKEEGVDETRFLDEFRERYLCSAPVTMTDGLVIKGGKTIRKVDVNEVLEQLEEPTQEESLGLIRVKVKAEKDEKEGFVTVAGNQGTVYLEPYTAYVAFQKSLEKDLKSLRETTAEVGKYLDNKVGDLQNAKSGPLAETKNSLLKLKPRVAQVQQATLDLKKKIAQAEKKLTAAVEEEKKRRLEAADKRAAAALVEDVAKLLQADEEALNKVLPAAEGLISSLGGDQENPVAAMEAADKEIAAVEESLAATMVKVKEKSEGMKGHQAKGPYSEAKNSLVKMKVKTGALENKCRKLRTGLQVAKNDMAKAAEDAILKALRVHVKEQGMSAEELFQKLGKGEESIQADTLRAFIEKIPDSQLKASQLDLALTRFSHGLSKLMVLDLVQEFQKCVKEIALTTALEVKDGKTVRKLAKGEVLEVLEVGRIDPATSLLRMRCRALVDLKEGWVTSQGNAGSSFLEACPKPFLCCGAESPLQEGFPSSSSERKRLQDGDVLEILEGPRKEEPPEVHRMKVKASQDGSTGWVTFKDGAGKEFFKPAKLMVCKQSIAITNSFDISAGKALRKLDVGEVLDVVEGPTEDSVRSLSRVKVLAKKDGAEGWVTVKGNQGTSYAEESDKHYICSESVALESKPASGSAETRKLEEGEIIQALEAPKVEKKAAIERCRGRHVGDSTEGWFTMNPKTFKPWTSTYKCVVSTVINDLPAVDGAKTLRKLEPGEQLEALQAPALEPTSGLLRIKCRTKKDNLVGFATVKGNQGTVLLSPLLAETAGKAAEKRPAEKAAAKKPEA